MHIALAPFRLKDGVSEEALIAASDDFEREFVSRQEGIVRRVLVRDGEVGFADLVFFEDGSALQRVIEAERTSDVCAAFMALMDGDDDYRVYEVVKSYG